MPKRYSLGLLLAAVSLLIGCGGTSSAPKNANSNFASQLTAASAVQFGAVPVGGTRSSSVAISNSATDGTVITVSQINVTGAGFRIGNTPAFPFTMAAGESVTFGIEFSPLSRASVVGKISIMSDASDSVLPVSLAGNGNAGAEITVNPPSMNFGTVGLGSSNVLDGTLTAANSPITVSTVNQTGQGYTLSGINFPLALSPGQSVPFTVTFTPEAPGPSTGTLAFVTNGSASAGATLTGSTAGAGAHSVQLSWNASSSPVIGYNIYRSPQPGGPYTRLTGAPQPVTSYADYGVQSGATYYYVATSVNGSSEESAYSNQTVATVP